MHCMMASASIELEGAQGQGAGRATQLTPLAL